MFSMHALCIVDIVLSGFFVLIMFGIPHKNIFLLIHATLDLFRTKEFRTVYPMMYIPYKNSFSCSFDELKYIAELALDHVTVLSV
jgi:hypothetical protein